MNSNRLGRYTHIRGVGERCAVGVNLVQKQVTAGTPVRQKELVDQGVQSTLLIPTEPIVLHKTIRRTQEVTNKRRCNVRQTLA